jgi:hypothetical protein
MMLRKMTGENPIKLTERACQLLVLANCADDQTLRHLQEVLESAFAKLLKPTM